jgi:hypothetical protein
MRRDNTGITQGFVCPGGQILGISSDVVIEASNAIDTWTQYSISLTPSEKGVVQLYGYAYGMSNCWFDDMSVS